MGRRYRRAWRGDADLEARANERLHDCGTIGELVEAWAWSGSTAQARTLLKRLTSQVDLSLSEQSIPYHRLWIRILEDRLMNGDRL